LFDNASIAHLEETAMNNTEIQTKLSAELAQVRQRLLDMLADSDQGYHQQLLSQLKDNPPSDWLELTANSLGPEYQILISRLEKLEAALCQIDIGQYGYCCDCEEKIDDERLLADPATQRCRRCAP
jgi:RNA polymerase-binding transcription factor DksA